MLLAFVEKRPFQKNPGADIISNLKIRHISDSLLPTFPTKITFSKSTISKKIWSVQVKNKDTVMTSVTSEQIEQI